jgi:serine/threonine protein kinase
MEKVTKTQTMHLFVLFFKKNFVFIFSFSLFLFLKNLVWMDGLLTFGLWSFFSFQIAMEYCGAGSIGDMMQICDLSLNEEQIACICYGALQGLHYLHSKHKIHRDIKAGNILMDEYGNVKLGSSITQIFFFFFSPKKKRLNSLTRLCVCVCLQLILECLLSLATHSASARV